MILYHYRSLSNHLLIIESTRMNLLVQREGLLYSLVAWKICLYHNQLPVDTCTCIINENKCLNTNYVQYRKTYEIN